MFHLQLVVNILKYLMVVHVVVLSLCPHADAAQHESDDKK